jgi:RNA polymerase sigma-70 factor (ECF subfamily)
LDEKAIQLLLEGCKNGKRESQKQLYSCFYGYAMAVCMRYTQNNEEAREVVNDGFMKIFTSIKKFTYQEKDQLIGFKAWMKKIMIFTAIDYFRKHEKYKYHTDIAEEGNMLVEESGNTIDYISYQELISMIQLLPPAYRTVFNLFVIDGFSHEEIAEQLGIAEGTSKSNLAKARAHLKEILKKSNQELYAKYAR